MQTTVHHDRIKTHNINLRQVFAKFRPKNGTRDSKYCVYSEKCSCSRNIRS